MQIFRCATLATNATPTFFSPKLTSSSCGVPDALFLLSNSDTKHIITSTPCSDHSSGPSAATWRRRAGTARAHALICDAALKTERIRLRQEVCGRLQSLQCAAQSSSSFSSLHGFLKGFFFPMCTTSQNMLHSLLRAMASISHRSVSASRDVARQNVSLFVAKDLAEHIAAPEERSHLPGDHSCPRLLGREKKVLVTEKLPQLFLVPLFLFSDETATVAVSSVILSTV